MELIDFIKLANRTPSFPFLVIGGYAVAAHGHTRPTFDVDFLVRQVNREAWFTKLQSADLRMIQQTPGFAQFTGAGAGEALDLMFVNDSTFNEIEQAAEERSFGALSARVPSLDHLLALKLHALKQGQ